MYTNVALKEYRWRLQEQYDYTQQNAIETFNYLKNRTNNLLPSQVSRFKASKKEKQYCLAFPLHTTQLKCKSEPELKEQPKADYEHTMQLSFSWRSPSQ